MGRMRRKVKATEKMDVDMCKHCSRAQRDPLPGKYPIFSHPEAGKRLAAVSKIIQDSDSEDSAIETGSVSSCDNISLSSEQSPSEGDQSSVCSIEYRCVEVSIKSIAKHDSLSPAELEDLTDFVTGVPLQRFTKYEHCQQCFEDYCQYSHELLHHELRQTGVEDSFYVDLTGTDVELRVDFAQPSDNSNQSFFITPQGATYYCDVSSCINPADLPKEAMIPPSEHAMFDSTHPPQRPWIPLANPERNKPTAMFTVMCYNVLCDKYCTRQLYGYSPSWALHWDYRKKGILEEIRHYNADIISLQEVETEQFSSFFLYELEKEGYTGVFAAKSRARTMQESEAKYVDGCAIFWKVSKFSLLSKHVIEFNQLAIANAEGSENILNRVMTKDNIGLCAMLETKQDIWEENGAPFQEHIRQPILISTVHVVWDPEFCDVKLIQSLMLMSELKRIVEGSPLSLRPGAAKVDCSKVPMILCGDLNSLPGSGVVEFLNKGKVSVGHLDFKDIDYEKVLDAFSHTKDNNYLTHAFKLKRAYDEAIMEYTNYTYDFKGVIDYVFYTEEHMKPLGVLGSLDKEWFRENKVVGCPHPHVPSDHFSLLCEFELSPVGR